MWKVEYMNQVTGRWHVLPGCTERRSYVEGYWDALMSVRIGEHLRLINPKGETVRQVTPGGMQVGMETYPNPRAALIEENEQLRSRLEALQEMLRVGARDDVDTQEGFEVLGNLHPSDRELVLAYAKACCGEE